MGKFCSFCGSQVPEGAAFCQKCGKPIPKNIPQPNNFPPPMNVNPPQAPEQEHKQKSEEIVEAIPQQQPTQQPEDKVQPEQKIPQVYQPPFRYEMPGVDLQVNADAVQSAPPEKKKSKKGKTIAISVISVVLVVAIVVTGVLFLPGLIGKEGKKDATQTTTAPFIPAEDLKRTVMVYMVGSNLESEYGSASADIEEMLDAEINTEKNNVLVYTGGANAWYNTDISANENAIFLVGQDDISKVNSFVSMSMGKSDTLTTFLDFGVENYPADKYSLILWDHGSGPLEGYGNDEVYMDFLSLEELSSALKKSAFGKQKLEVLGFDACLMGSVETAWMLKDYAEYFVASQELEPGTGWNYSFLESLNDCGTGAELGTLIVDKYFEYYEETFEQYPYYETDITLSCTDLSKVSAVESAMDELFSVVNEDVVSGNITTVSRCRNRTKSFGKVADGNFTGFDLIDVKHLASLLETDYSELSQKLETALDNYVIYSRSNILNANGVSAYHPYDNFTYAQVWVPAYQALGFAKEYSGYLQSFYNHITGNSTSSSGSYRTFSKTAGVSVENNNKSDLSIQLTDEQAKYYSNAQYIVYYKMSADKTFSGEEEYLRIFVGSDAVLSADGTLNASYEDKAVFGKMPSTGEYTEHPLSMEQIYDGQGTPKYYFICGFGKDYFTEDFEYTVVKWLMNLENGVPTLAGAFEATSTDNITPDKHVYNAADYETYDFMNYAVVPETNDDGVTYFRTTDSFYGYQFTREEGVELEYKAIEDKEDYYAVFRVTDIYGNVYYSDFFSLAG